MNLNRYEKINGREALKRLVDGEIIFDSYGTHYKVVHKPVFDEVWLYYTSKDGGNGKSRIEVSVFISNNWYIPKSFDVREAMFDRPNEWVGAYKGPYGTWYKVGFDGMYMTAIFTELEHKIEATHDTDGVRPIFFDYSRYLSGRDDRTLSVLGSCIPIEDVPEEATR